MPRAGSFGLCGRRSLHAYSRTQDSADVTFRHPLGSFLEWSVSFHHGGRPISISHDSPFYFAEQSRSENSIMRRALGGIGRLAAGPTHAGPWPACRPVPLFEPARQTMTGFFDDQIKRNGDQQAGDAKQDGNKVIDQRTSMNVQDKPSCYAQ
ncbi:MAG TPA: hypothetical protein VMI53_10830, partial [Opitutaceae bacterium]|nr:hypothetical protein [Opitutaceae bacterium]